MTYIVEVVKEDRPKEKFTFEHWQDAKDYQRLLLDTFKEDKVYIYQCRRG